MEEITDGVVPGIVMTGRGTTTDSGPQLHAAEPHINCNVAYGGLLCKSHYHAKTTSH